MQSVKLDRPFEQQAASVLEKFLPSSLGAGDAALPELYFEWSMTVGAVGSVPFYA